MPVENTAEDPADAAGEADTRETLTDALEAARTALEELRQVAHPSTDLVKNAAQTVASIEQALRSLE